MKLGKHWKVEWKIGFCIASSAIIRAVQPGLGWRRSWGCKLSTRPRPRKYATVVQRQQPTDRFSTISVLRLCKESDYSWSWLSAKPTYCCGFYVFYVFSCILSFIWNTCILLYFVCTFLYFTTMIITPLICWFWKLNTIWMISTTSRYHSHIISWCLIIIA